MAEAVAVKDGILLVGEIDYGSAGGSNYTEWTPRADIKFSQKWNIGIGYREFESDINESSLRNQFRRTGASFTYSYSF